MKRTTVNSLPLTELHDHQLEAVRGAQADAGAGGNGGADPTTVPGLLQIRNRALQEAAERHSADAGAAADGGASGGAPSNADAYFGQLPSIPAHLINPPSYTPQIIIEPVGGGGLY